MSVAALGRLIDEWIAVEPASLTVHTAIDFVTGSLAGTVRFLR
jgi:hypothetical protein